MVKVAVPLRGMHCAGCVKTIEDLARAQPGVGSAQVNFASEEAALDVDPGLFRAPAFQQALRDRGYHAQPRRLVYRVTGLDAAAVAGLEARLRALPGILAASANYGASSVAVDLIFDPGVLDVLRAEGLRPEPEETRERDTELRDLTIKTGISLVLAAAVMILSMRHLGPPWLWLLLTLPVQFWAGWEFHAGFLRSLRHFRADMNALVSIGTSAAFFSGPFVAMPYYDTAATIIAVVLLGRLLEKRARRGTRRAVEALLELAPRADVKPGDERDLKPGERVPADGVVIAGAGALDESMLTGESLPVDKSPGDRVLGGTLNRTGSLRVRFDRTGDDTVLAQIVRLVRRAQGTKPPAQRLADLWASRFVPAVLLVSAGVLAFWLWRNPARALEATVAVLVVACPCAFGLATPAAIMVAAGRAARRGLLFKDADALESLGRLDRIVFDKTGTLTLGRPALAAADPAPGVSREELLRVAAAIERRSEHPLAKAIAAAVPEGPAADDFDARPGLGAAGRVDGREVFVGSRAFFSILGIAVPATDATVFVAADGRYLGSLRLADEIRPESAAVVADLKRLGVRVALLSGDDRAVAARVAQALAIDDVKAEVMPPDKAAAILEWQAQGRVGMVGDGINDAPALAQADVGLAVQQGTDVAIESADVVLMKNDLTRVVTGVRLSRALRRVIHQNFAWAFGYNALLIPLAAAGALTPMLAGAAMAFSSLAVVLNSLRLNRA